MYLNPGLFDDNPCKAFFGQDSRIDYFFFIQWFNDNLISEDNFLSNSPGFQPQPGNNWFWADIVSYPGSGIVNNLSQETFATRQQHKLPLKELILLHIQDLEHKDQVV